MITSAGEREQYASEGVQGGISLSHLLLGELSLKYGDGDLDKQTVSERRVMQRR